MASKQARKLGKCDSYLRIAIASKNICDTCKASSQACLRSVFLSLPQASKNLF